MTTWAIGDVQGCMSSLERLLDRIELDPARDRVWLVGDLVNRGPRSLDVLRWARDLDARGALTTVLGNHDLHLLARAAGAAGEKKRDTLDDVLAAPDRDALIDWLRRQPLAVVDDQRILVHAGVYRRWDAARVRALAGEVEAGLRSDDWKRWIQQIQGNGDKLAWDDGLTGATRLRAILGYLVRVRCVDDKGVPDPEFDGHPRQARKGLHAWFDEPEPAWGDHQVVFGHWAALGLSIGTRTLGLDSGCVWGNQLTAVRLDDSMVVQVKSVEKAS